ncbi:SDR family NAD(P)-dependent oxidoreductase [Wolbachia endosymbiont (group E) of Neria commutata]|uniref:SDR family NAD(P)-dependent oxidoreductase n=1 Tax=Wolbachia endosymbiont (group E) of Neria commutata TaxID=3066149 RepID=UPI003132B872
MNRKVCLITGASSGIGESLARLLIKYGWFVVGTTRRSERLEKLKEELGTSFPPELSINLALYILPLPIDVPFINFMLLSS